MSVTPGIKIASPTDSPFAVAVMFFGNGLVMASSFSRMPGIRDQVGGEGAANDWLALMLVDNRGAPAAFGALTYAGFNVTMALGRFAGGFIIQRFGRAPVLRVAGTLASTGVAALCLGAFDPNRTDCGALAWGLGLSVVFPSAMSAAGEVPGRGSRAIAVVSTIGYGGFLFGAPLIGFLAHMMPLDRALLAVAALVLLVAILAPVAREHGRELAKA